MRAIGAAVKICRRHFSGGGMRRLLDRLQLFRWGGRYELGDPSFVQAALGTSVSFTAHTAKVMPSVNGDLRAVLDVAAFGKEQTAVELSLDPLADSTGIHVPPPMLKLFGSAEIPLTTDKRKLLKQVAFGVARKLLGDIFRSESLQKLVWASVEKRAMHLFDRLGPALADPDRLSEQPDPLEGAGWSPDGANGHGADPADPAARQDGQESLVQTAAARATRGRPLWATRSQRRLARAAAGVPAPRTSAAGRQLERFAGILGQVSAVGEQLQQICLSMAGFADFFDRPGGEGTSIVDLWRYMPRFAELVVADEQLTELVALLAGHFSKAESLCSTSALEAAATHADNETSALDSLLSGGEGQKFKACALELFRRGRDLFREVALLLPVAKSTGQAYEDVFGNTHALLDTDNPLSNVVKPLVKQLRAVQRATRRLEEGFAETGGASLQAARAGLVQLRTRALASAITWVEWGASVVALMKRQSGGLLGRLADVIEAIAFPALGAFGDRTVAGITQGKLREAVKIVTTFLRDLDAAASRAASATGSSGQREFLNRWKLLVQSHDWEQSLRDMSRVLPAIPEETAGLEQILAPPVEKSVAELPLAVLGLVTAWQRGMAAWFRVDEALFAALHPDTGDDAEVYPPSSLVEGAGGGPEGGDGGAEGGAGPAFSRLEEPDAAPEVRIGASSAWLRAVRERAEALTDRAPGTESPLGSMAVAMQDLSGELSRIYSSFAVDNQQALSALVFVDRASRVVAEAGEAVVKADTLIRCGILFAWSAVERVAAEISAGVAAGSLPEKLERLTNRLAGFFDELGDDQCLHHSVRQNLPGGVNRWLDVILETPSTIQVILGTINQLVAWTMGQVDEDGDGKESRMLLPMMMRIAPGTLAHYLRSVESALRGGEMADDGRSAGNTVVQALGWVSSMLKLAEQVVTVSQEDDPHKYMVDLAHSSVGMLMRTVEGPAIQSLGRVVQSYLDKLHDDPAADPAALLCEHRDALFFHIEQLLDNMVQVEQSTAEDGACCCVSGPCKWWQKEARHVEGTVDGKPFEWCCQTTGPMHRPSECPATGYLPASEPGASDMAVDGEEEELWAVECKCSAEAEDSADADGVYAQTGVTRQRLEGLKREGGPLGEAAWDSGGRWRACEHLLGAGAESWACGGQTTCPAPQHRRYCAVGRQLPHVTAESSATALPSMGCPQASSASAVNDELRVAIGKLQKKFLSIGRRLAEKLPTSECTTSNIMSMATKKVQSMRRTWEKFAALDLASQVNVTLEHAPEPVRTFGGFLARALQALMEAHRPLADTLASECEDATRASRCLPSVAAAAGALRAISGSLRGAARGLREAKAALPAALPRAMRPRYGFEGSLAFDHGAKTVEATANILVSASGYAYCLGNVTEVLSSVRSEGEARSTRVRIMDFSSRLAGAVNNCFKGDTGFVKGDVRHFLEGLKAFFSASTSIVQIVDLNQPPNPEKLTWGSEVQEGETITVASDKLRIVRRGVPGKTVSLEKQCQLPVKVTARVACVSARALNQSECQSEGCCYSPLEEGSWAPWCYQPPVEHDFAYTLVSRSSGETTCSAGCFGGHGAGVAGATCAVLEEGGGGDEGELGQYVLQTLWSLPKSLLRAQKSLAFAISSFTSGFSRTQGALASGFLMPARWLLTLLSEMQKQLPSSLAQELAQQRGASLNVPVVPPVGSADYEMTARMVADTVQALGSKDALTELVNPLIEAFLRGKGKKSSFGILHISQLVRVFTGPFVDLPVLKSPAPSKGVLELIVDILQPGVDQGEVPGSWDPGTWYICESIVEDVRQSLHELHESSRRGRQNDMAFWFSTLELQLARVIADDPLMAATATPSYMAEALPALRGADPDEIVAWIDKLHWWLRGVARISKKFVATSTAGGSGARWSLEDMRGAERLRAALAALHGAIAGAPPLPLPPAGEGGGSQWRAVRVAAAWLHESTAQLAEVADIGSSMVACGLLSLDLPECMDHDHPDHGDGEDAADDELDNFHILRDVSINTARRLAALASPLANAAQQVGQLPKLLPEQSGTNAIRALLHTLEGMKAQVVLVLQAVGASYDSSSALMVQVGSAVVHLSGVGHKLQLVATTLSMWQASTAAQLEWRSGCQPEMSPPVQGTDISLEGDLREGKRPVWSRCGESRGDPQDVHYAPLIGITDRQLIKISLGPFLIYGVPVNMALGLTASLELAYEQARCGASENATLPGHDNFSSLAVGITGSLKAVVSSSIGPAYIHVGASVSLSLVELAVPLRLDISPAAGAGCASVEPLFSTPSLSLRAYIRVLFRYQWPVMSLPNSVLRMPGHCSASDPSRFDCCPPVLPQPPLQPARVEQRRVADPVYAPVNLATCSPCYLKETRVSEEWDDEDSPSMKKYYHWHCPAPPYRTSALAGLNLDLLDAVIDHPEVQGSHRPKSVVQTHFRKRHDYGLFALCDERVSWHPRSEGLPSSPLVHQASGTCVTAERPENQGKYGKVSFQPCQSTAGQRFVATEVPSQSSRYVRLKVDGMCLQRLWIQGGSWLFGIGATPDRTELRAADCADDETAQWFDKPAEDGTLLLQNNNMCPHRSAIGMQIAMGEGGCVSTPSRGGGGEFLLEAPHVTPSGQVAHYSALIAALPKAALAGDEQSHKAWQWLSVVVLPDSSHAALPVAHDVPSPGARKAIRAIYDLHVAKTQANLGAGEVHPALLPSETTLTGGGTQNWLVQPPRSAWPPVPTQLYEARLSASADDGVAELQLQRRTPRHLTGLLEGRVMMRPNRLNRTVLSTGTCTACKWKNNIAYSRGARPRSSAPCTADGASSPRPRGRGSARRSCPPGSAGAPTRWAWGP
ncbi:unnamed protein product [Prorocentrum cordatum]|nr:unnamed protein product [Polarella glacialis]